MFGPQTDNRFGFRSSSALETATAAQPSSIGRAARGGGTGLVDPIQGNTLLRSAEPSRALSPDLSTDSTILKTTALSSSLIDTTINPIIFWPWSDNTLDTANNVGTLSATQSFNGSVGSSDTQDYYHFNLASTSHFNLSLTGLSADADVQLLNAVGSLVASSARGGTNDESINLQSLTAGDYYVRVYQYLGDTSYSLKLSTNSISDLLPTEVNFGTLSGTRTYSGVVGSDDTADVYRFSLGAASGFNLTLSGLGSDADVRLVYDANNNGIVDSGETLGWSTHSGMSAEWISNSLAAGNYLVEVYQYTGNTNYNLSISTGDWYSTYLSDPGIIGQLRTFDNDGVLSRTEMMSVLRETEDYGSIDATEVSDLRRVVSSLGYRMPDYVRNLTNKIVNGDPANPRSGIGNLYAGSSSTQMENLIGKWFLGTDRPTAAGTYQYVSGSLFQSGISVSDIDQGGVGDCYFMSSLGAFANDRPAVINNMFIDNGDGTFTVRFYNGSSTEYVTVDRYLPTDASGNAVYAGWGGGSNTSSSNELWAALAEKAYAQLNESGWIGQDNTNSYAGLDGGWMAPVMRQITGDSASSMSANSLSMSQSLLISLVNSDTPITAGFVSGGGYGVVNSHAYTITSYDASTGRFHLNNPWGYYHADVTWDQLRALNAQIEWSNV